MPTPLQKQCHFKFSEKNFGLHEPHPETFLSTIITGEEK
jgi:hypothetical protein